MADDTVRPLEGRIAIVTGASRGIGKGIAERLGSAGATVIVAARTLGSAGKFKGTAQETCDLIIERGGRAFALPLNLEDPASRKALIERAISEAGHVDILVNNAGTAIYKKTDEMTLEEANAQVQTYFLGPWHLCHEILPHMKSRGRGWILNLGSCSFFPHEQPPYEEFNAARGDETLYATLKTAMHRFTKGLAAEVHQHNISVNLVAPVMAIFTPGLDALGIGAAPDVKVDGKTAGVISRLNRDRDPSELVNVCEPIEHIAEAAVELLSHEPRDCTAQIAFSFQYLDAIGRPTRTLDNQRVFQERKGPKQKVSHVG